MRIYLILMAFIFSKFCNADPLERFEPKSVAKAVALASELGNSRWSYSWRGKEYEFVFEEDGSISNLTSWKDVRWVVVSENEVVLEGYTDRMHLFFN